MSFEEGKKNARQLFNDHKDADGIFINTDLVAIGAMTEFNKLGVKIPEDISIVGFSNWFMSSVVSPSLTTINQPGYEMGKAAFKQLYKEMKQIKKTEPIIYKEIVLKTELIKRQSTKEVIL
jgi:LacI family transcriptional regulator